jgi:hypothetical protein
MSNSSRAAMRGMADLTRVQAAPCPRSLREAEGVSLTAPERNSSDVSPTLEQLIRHARLFGAECVYETGEQAGLSRQDLARLRIECDALEAKRTTASGRFTVGTRRRRSEDETRSAVLALSVDGFVPSAIADKLGISDRTVRSYLRQTGASAPELVRDVPK